jgi:hypothetical protein
MLFDPDAGKTMDQILETIWRRLSESFSGKRLSEVSPFLVEKRKQHRMKTGGTALEPFLQFPQVSSHFPTNSTTDFTTL